MPTIKPVSELQRNAAALVKEAMETKEPIYLTRNGSAAVVMLDAAAYDDFVRAARDTHRQYVQASVMLGRLQNDMGMSRSWEEVKQELREKWGDDAF